MVYHVCLLSHLSDLCMLNSLSAVKPPAGQPLAYSWRNTLRGHCSQGTIVSLKYLSKEYRQYRELDLALLWVGKVPVLVSKHYA